MTTSSSSIGALIPTAPSEPDLSLLLRQSTAMIEADPQEAKKRFHLTLEEHEDRAMLEASLYGRVKRRCKKYGWLLVHFSQAQVGGGAMVAGAWATPVAGNAKGFPDIFLAKPGVGIAFVELKRQLGKLRPEQEAWVDLLRSLGQNVFVWRPEDLRLGRIEEFLKQ